MQKYYSLLLFLSSFIVFSQQPAKPNSVEIYNQIKKLNFLGSVLYIAAHPDDENTRLIAYYANQVHARTGYLSLTRGDGGQNLIGPELRELLGVIRTQELIEARKIDGGEQLFTRANDFGFSKTPDETLQIWNKDEVLSDVVWAIRKFQPDVIINRFDHRTAGTTHGHHTASAMLGIEAFELVNNPDKYSNQLKHVSTWQPKRLFFNTSWWFYGSKENFEKADKSNLINLKTGVYYEMIGKSNQEIAALSRSRHQSQGFGSTGTRGEEDEYLELLKGDLPKDKNNIFEGIDTTWNRVSGGKEIGTLLNEVENNFDFKNPSASVPNLVKAYTLIQNLENNHWKTIKTEEIKKIIAACSGLYLEAVANNQEVAMGSKCKIKLELINRSAIKMDWISAITGTKIPLENNKVITKEYELEIDENSGYTNPYWLNQKGTTGMYRVDNQENISKPDVINRLIENFLIEINGVTIPFEKNIIYKYNDDVKGEIYQPLDIIPVVSSNFTEKVYLFNSEKAQKIAVNVIAGTDTFNGKVSIIAPQNWKVFPTEIPVSFDKKGQEKTVGFMITPSKNAEEIVLKSNVTYDGNYYDQQKIDINHQHIYKQMVLQPSEAKALKLDIKIVPKNIAYIMGAGDEVPNSLKQLGYNVTLIKPQDITFEKLKNHDVIITGIRAYNILNELKFKQKILFNLVENGKTMIVQYNTAHDLVTNEIAPYSLKISRDRVTQESAEVRFLAPKHSVLNYPNKITTADFTNWTQEQGLYYPSEWETNFTAILSSNDVGEKPKDGALLVAKHGKGFFIYTGLSFFRELPEGVSGAYRLFANLISVK